MQIINTNQYYQQYIYKIQKQNFRSTTQSNKINKCSGTDIFLFLLFLLILGIDLGVEILEFILDPFQSGKVVTGVFFGIQVIVPALAFLFSRNSYITYGFILLFAGIAADIAFNMIVIDVDILTVAQYVFLWISIPVFVAQVCWSVRWFWLYSIYRRLYLDDREENDSLIK